MSGCVARGNFGRLFLFGVAGVGENSWDKETVVTKPFEQGTVLQRRFDPRSSKTLGARFFCFFSFVVFFLSWFSFFVVVFVLRFFVFSGGFS